jgi:hypothetical protein
MTTFPAGAAWPACLSALALDRWAAGELGPERSEEVRAHVAGCARCATAAESLRPARDAEPLPPLRATAAPPAARIRGVVAVTAGLAGLAAAAGIAVAVRTDVLPGRTKGPDVGIAAWVLHGDAVRRAGPGEVVAPGDALRFAITTPTPCYAAVLSLDPAGRASIYFPVAPRAAPVAAGADVPLPAATRLDATVGEEHVVALLCERPVELEPVRAALEAGSAGAIPEGCKVTRWSFVKR